MNIETQHELEVTWAKLKLLEERFAEL